ncbi:ABC transporter substrate-binding protein [Algoriphagus sanaruensis]|uniref:Leucine-binding protein domain-containing protein n=1 Tax=Algoriphagus sanaruensis TaxID=1727163 RepID=A0A142ELX0_9BACT|nr:ABC transporter substrate-binding protein [Algoriphagus sanaruensis]AMQ56125.1 hypothetical protein AO498_06845 [Algoriphagus sanaruensis]
MRKILLSISAFFCFLTGFSQNTPEAYLKAKQSLISKDYWAAINQFTPFLDQSNYGKLAPYAALQLAEAALAVNQPSKAIEALSPFYATDWKYSDESKYLLLLAYFQNNQTVEALRIISSIKNETIKSKANNAAFEFLLKESPSFFVTNLEEFKAIPSFSAALGQVFEQKSILSSSEQEALVKIRASGKVKSVNDGQLDIALILPFSSPNASLSQGKPTDFVFELYQGMALAVEQLKRQGKKIQLNSFDSKRDVNQLSTILKDENVRSSDVLVGPIYQEETSLVSSFAEAEKIPFVHPLSNLGDRFEESAYSYLFRPSVASLSKGIQTAITSQNWGKSVAIAHSGSSRDENLAGILQQELTAKGFKVVKMQRVDARNVLEFFQGLGVRRENTPSVQQVILLTDDPAIAQSTFGLMESINTSLPVLVMDSWLGFNFANFEMLEFPNFYFIANNTPRFSSPEMDLFREAFYTKYLAFPSLNAVVGYELIYWLDQNAKENLDFDLRSGLDLSRYSPGKLTWGYNFTNSHNNTHVPVFKFEMGQLVPLN